VHLTDAEICRNIFRRNKPWSLTRTVLDHETMPRLAQKPDSSFFRKIVIGAVGTRAVAADLAARQHEMVELERGSTDTKLWKDVKRKRVRIPDLVCLLCGLRVESRAKTKPELSMSHSLTDEARAWDFGMVDSDCIAFPVCEAVDEKYWSAGKLSESSSYWHERNWVRWESNRHINYFNAGVFRSTPATKTSTKGVTEGSETTLAWDAVFASGSAVVESATGQRLTIRRTSDGRRQTRNLRGDLLILVQPGDAIQLNQIIASPVRPLTEAELACPGHLTNGHIAHLLSSRERTQRFTGVKLARLRREGAHGAVVAEFASDQEEDVYIRLEAISYLASVSREPGRYLFDPYLKSADEQTQLEAVIALGETATAGAVELLCEILDDERQPYFVRSAAAWCLGRVGSTDAANRLIQAFSDVDLGIREEALDGVVHIGGPAIPIVLAGLRGTNEDIIAGCAEALRQQQPLESEVLSELLDDLRRKDPSQWTAWLLGHLPRDQVSTAISGLQDTAPQLHYAISVLWSFVESWIARRWELNPGPAFPQPEDSENV